VTRACRRHRALLRADGARARASEPLESGHVARHLASQPREHRARTRALTADLTLAADALDARDVYYFDEAFERAREAV